MDKILNIVNNKGIAEIRLIGLIGYENDGFSANTSELMRAEILELKNTNPTRINLKIASVGGVVQQVERMKQDLASTGIPLDIDYLDKSASAALAFGEIAENVRLPENQLLLIHEVRASGVDGTADGLESAARTMRNMNANIIRGYVAQSKRTGKNKNADEFLNIMRRNDNRGEWLGANELLDLGLITEITPAYNFSNQVTNEILNKYGLPTIPSNPKLNINTNKNHKRMDLLNFFKDKNPNLLEIGESKAIYNGKLQKGTELVPVGKSEVKNGTYEVDNFTVEILDNVVTNYSKISKVKEAVNIADFKNEFDEIKAENKAFKTSLTENTEATNTAIETLTNSVKELKETINNLQTEGSPVDLPKAENLGETENVVIDPQEQSEARLEAKQKEINKKRNIQ